jgi:biotin transport system substrate-specific component
MKFSVKEITLVGIFTALTAIFAQVSIPIPFSPVPITLSIFAVFMTSIILGKKCGTMSMLIYVLIGAIGVPVFAGLSGGFDIIAGPKGGYILSYPIMAFLIGMIIEKKKEASSTDLIGILVVGLIICYSLGATWLAITIKADAAKAISVGVAPFLPLDLLKIVLAAVVGNQVRATLIKANLLKTYSINQ